MGLKRLFSLLALVFALSGVAFSVSAQSDTSNAAPKAEKKDLNVAGIIFGHIADAHEWHIFNIGQTPVVVPLPVIIYNTQKGLSVFSSSKFEEGEGHYNGYTLNKVALDKGSMKETITSDDNAKIYDISITKNVFFMIISTVLLLWIMTSAAKKYKKLGSVSAPTGFQNALESVILFIRDEVAKPILGHKYQRYMPLLLTLFFFIWINNLFGLLPGGANFTGNIAVTGCLALVSFIVILASSNKHFWSHLFNPPDVPFVIKCILVPIEIISLFIKPMALMIRLFANMMAGHIVILSIICLIFIFGVLNKFIGIGFVPISLAFSIMMFLLELLVGAIQAFIFANLTAVFIGQAIEGEHSDETGQAYHVSHDEIIV
ncbi:MAG TPA: F0F1 ATP synthase subunit A [Flavipsychrobacter sp.]|nr:F0F1 ATP synthase subunit A [Flavipsychrobacter sp.]